MTALKELSNFQIAVLILGFILILTWLGFVTYWINHLLTKYTFNRDYDNPYKEETLGLPPGTLRGILTLSLLVIVVLLVCMSMLVNQLQGAYDELINAFEIVLAFYFGNRIVNGISKSDIAKADKRLESELAKSQAEIASRNVAGTASSPAVVGGFDVAGSQG